MSTDTFPNPWRIRSNDKVHKIIEKYIYIYLDAELGINFRILLLPPPSPLGKTLDGGERNFSSGASKGSLYLFVWGNKQDSRWYNTRRGNYYRVVPSWIRATTNYIILHHLETWTSWKHAINLYATVSRYGSEFFFSKEGKTKPVSENNFPIFSARPRYSQKFSLLLPFDLPLRRKISEK